MTLDESKDEKDTVQTVDGINLVFDDRVAFYIDGATLDYKKTLFGHRFAIEGDRHSGTC